MGKGPKLLDSAAKLSTELDLEGMLRLLGLIPEGGGRVEPIERETVLPQLRIDYGCRFTAGNTERIFILEFLARWKSGIELRLRRYHRAGELKYSRPVSCQLVLLSRKGAPKRILNEDRFGEHRFRNDPGEPFVYQLHKMWEIPASILLESGSKDLYTLVPLTDHRPEDVLEAARRLQTGQDHDYQQRLRTFCGINYSQEEIVRLLGSGGGGMWIEELARESSIVKAIAEKAREEGRKAGRAQGRKEGREKGREESLQEVREILRSLVADRFPDAGAMPKINQLSHGELLLALKGVAAARDARQARKAIRDARRQ